MLFISPPAAGQTFKKPQFHPPQTSAEKYLDALLMQSARDDNIHEYLLGRPSYEVNKDSGYNQWVTTSLVMAIRDKERSLVKENCNGAYRDGEMCGMDIHLPFCAQDISDRAFLFHTLEQTADQALIVYAWQEHLDQQAFTASPRFRMIKEKNLWKLDGLDCGKDYRFNIR